MKLLSTLLLSCSCLLTAGLAQAQQAQATLPMKSINAGIHVIHAEVANNETQRELGLMYRKTMPENNGMLFVFDQPAGICMWMKNTILPLSVAFMDSTGKIINIADMKPQTEDAHCAYGPAKYALEMNLHWFKQKHVEAGTVITGLQ